MTGVNRVATVIATATALAVAVAVVAVNRYHANPALVANGLAATAAVVVNVEAGLRGPAGLRAMRLTRGFLATMYAALIWGQIVGLLAVADRIRVNTWVGPTVWIVVWIVPNLVPRVTVTGDEITAAVATKLDEAATTVVTHAARIIVTADTVAVHVARLEETAASVATQLLAANVATQLLTTADTVAARLDDTSAAVSASLAVTAADIAAQLLAAQAAAE